MYESILSASTVGIFTHMSADGDALGSSFGLVGFLNSLKKNCFVFLPSQISETISFIVPESEKHKVIIYNESQTEYIQSIVDQCDLLIGLDFNTMERIGGMAGFFLASTARKILVDHHVGPQREHFDMVYSDVNVSSACELLYRLLMETPVIANDASRLNQMSREALLTGMTTDTNNFANSVYPGTFKMASELIAAGTDRDKIIQKIFFSYDERRLRAQGYMLENLMTITPDGVAYVVMDRGTQLRFNLQEGETEGFVNIPLSIDRVRLSILLKEETAPDSKKIRVSLRSKQGTSARDCAMAYFHGGGHELASGGKLIKGEDIASIEEAGEYIERCTHEFFMER